MLWLDVNYIAFSILDYPVSYLELLATLFGLVSVYLATRPSILTWPSGIANEIGFFILFFQVQLYADMLLQVYFFIVTVYGWIHWRSKKQELPITSLSTKYRISIGIIMIAGCITLGYTISYFHIWWPKVFPKSASYPFVDAFTTVASVIAMILLARKVVESWVLWIAVDIVSIWLYIQKSIYLVAIEYGVFLVLASYGFLRWRKQIA